jgi:hypothetical protein
MVSCAKSTEPRARYLKMNLRPGSIVPHFPIIYAFGASLHYGNRAVGNPGYIANEPTGRLLLVVDAWRDMGSTLDVRQNVTTGRAVKGPRNRCQACA